MKTNTYFIVTSKDKEEWEVSTDVMAKLKVDNLAKKMKEDVQLFNKNNELIYTAKYVEFKLG